MLATKDGRAQSLLRDIGKVCFLSVCFLFCVIFRVVRGTRCLAVWSSRMRGSRNSQFDGPAVKYQRQGLNAIDPTFMTFSLSLLTHSRPKRIPSQKKLFRASITPRMASRAGRRMLA